MTQVIEPGTKFGRLTVLSATRLGKRAASVVECACGIRKPVLNYNLKSGATSSCGKCGKEHESLVGQVFGHLTVLRDVDPKAGTRQWRSLCQCACGNSVQITVPNNALKSGNTRSCGCFQKARQLQGVTRHGHTRHGKACSRTYQSWKDMLRRCNVPGTTNYDNYGGRGIRVCEAWRQFETFLVDMGQCPDGLTIERIDSNGHYEPGNCRWATPKEQARNKCTNHVVTYKGVTACLKDVCKAFGLPYERVKSRLRRGCSVELAFDAPDVKGSQTYFKRMPPQEQERGAD